jgi:hypothetical protein
MDAVKKLTNRRANINFLLLQRLRNDISKYVKKIKMLIFKESFSINIFVNKKLVGLSFVTRREKRLMANKYAPRSVSFPRFSVGAGRRTSLPSCCFEIW